MTPKTEETPLYFATASILRILMHQFVLSGSTPQERAAIQADLYKNIMKDLSHSQTDEATLKAAAGIVAAIFGAQSNIAPRN